jgi:hypothetical protein
MAVGGRMIRAQESGMRPKENGQFPFPDRRKRAWSKN